MRALRYSIVFFANVGPEWTVQLVTPTAEILTLPFNENATVHTYSAALHPICFIASCSKNIVYGGGPQASAIPLWDSIVHHLVLASCN